MGLVYVFVMVETAARTSHAGCGFLSGYWISENVLVGEGWVFFQVRGGGFLFLQEISYRCKLESQLWAKHRTGSFQWYQKEILYSLA